MLSLRFPRRARPFVAAIKRIGDPDLSEQVSGLVLDIGEITEAYTLKADLQGVIDHLREAAAESDVWRVGQGERRISGAERSHGASRRQITEVRFRKAHSALRGTQ